jgi:hypothetical protein
MATESLFKTFEERVDMEKVLLFVMLIAAIYMIVESFRFDISQAATFPRLTAGFVVIGTVLLLLRPTLPEPLYSFVAKDATLIQTDDDFEEEEMGLGSDDEDSKDGLRSEVGRPVPDSVFTGAIAVVYGLAGYAAGILWVTPLFVAAYGAWFKLDWRVVATLVAISFALAFGFMEALNSPIDSGEIINRDGL